MEEDPNEIDEILDASDSFDELLENRSEESNSNDEDSSSGPEIDNSDILYDRSLPSEHVYLGTDLEELSGRTILDENEFLELPLLSFVGVVLIPGQILPLKIGHPPTVSMLRDIILKDRTFGIVVKVPNRDSRTQSLASIGTTAEIRSFKEEHSAETGFSQISIKAEGRQRFTLHGSPRRRVDGILIGKVRVLPEICMQDPGLNIKPKVFEKFQLLVSRDSNQPSSNRSSDKRKYRKFQYCDITRWPHWVYEQYDPEFLAKRIKSEFKSWTNAVDIESMPNDPVELSYWVASNLPLDDSLKIMLLSRNCMIQRLRCEISILEKYKMLYCKECSRSIAQKEDLFSLSLVGPQGTYVNPGGHVHEIITVLKAKNIHEVSLPIYEYSWFPGYAWTNINCRGCHGHMGWRFSTENKRLKPQVFWGLCRRALIPGILPDQEKWEPCW